MTECVSLVGRGGSSVVGAPLQNLGKFVYPTLPVSFGGDTKRHRSLLSGVYARVSKISHTGGKCVTCRGLYSIPGGLMTIKKNTNSTQNKSQTHRAKQYKVS